MTKPKVILTILDGWGFSSLRKGNAITQAETPNFDRFWQHYPRTLLSASGEAVGLPWGELGSSEVGHLTIGSGQVVYQNLLRVARAIKDNSFFNNQVLLTSIEYARQKHTALHLIGLVSPGGVHSHIDHLKALLLLIKKQKFTGPCYIHMFTDGRDTPPQSANVYLQKLQEFIEELNLQTQIASVSGRYYAMDRDNHWERTLAAYEAIVDGKGENATTPANAISNAYKRQETDEFIKPTVISIPDKKSFWQNLRLSKSSSSTITANVQNNDSIIFFNFRPDRMRQLIELFLFPRTDMSKKTIRHNLHVSTLTEYAQHLPTDVAFPPDNISVPLAKILSDNNFSQLHIAETEKYAHVTYFFNGGNPEPYPGEQWHLVPSPRIATYDKKPEMSANTITDYIISSSKSDNYDFILINYANADMVGHTGNLKATIKAVQVIDEQLGRLNKAFPESYLVVTADHGNAEQMINSQTGENDTEHSINPVPFIIIHPSLRRSHQTSIDQPTGILADITPTILNIFGIPIIPEISGYNLLQSLAPEYRPHDQLTDNSKA